MTPLRTSPPPPAPAEEPSRSPAGTGPAAYVSSGIPHLRRTQLILERIHVLGSPPLLTPRPSTPETKEEPLGRRRPRTWGRGEGGRVPATPASPASRQRRGPAALPAAPPGCRAPTGKPQLARKAPGCGSRGAPGPRRACQPPARGRCPGPDTAPRAQPSPQLRRSRVRITLRSGSRRGAILSPGAAARPRPSPRQGAPGPRRLRAAGLTRALGCGSRGRRRAALPGDRPPRPGPAQPGPTDTARQTPAGGGRAGPAGGAGGSQAHKAALCPGPGRSGAAERGVAPFSSPGRRGAPAGGSGRRRAPGAGGRPSRPASRAGSARPRGAAGRRCEKPPGAGVARATEQRDNMEETGKEGGGREGRGGEDERRGSRALAGSRRDARLAGRRAGGGGPERGSRAGGRHSQEYGYSLKTVA